MASRHSVFPRRVRHDPQMVKVFRRKGRPWCRERTAFRPPSALVTAAIGGPGHRDLARPGPRVAGTGHLSGPQVTAPEGACRGPPRSGRMGGGEPGPGRDRSGDGLSSSYSALAAGPNRGAMDTKTNAPSFTVSLRGYDREEVDEYLDSLAEALDQVEEAEAHTRRLQAHVAKCNARIKELEDRIRADTPKSGIALGERIGDPAHEAEEAASDAISRAEAEAARIVADAEARSAEAEELMRSATARAEEPGPPHRDPVARGEAADIVPRPKPARPPAPARSSNGPSRSSRTPGPRKPACCRSSNGPRMRPPWRSSGTCSRAARAGHRLSERPAGGPGPGRRAGRGGPRRRSRRSAAVQLLTLLPA